MTTMAMIVIVAASDEYEDDKVKYHVLRTTTIRIIYFVKKLFFYLK